MRIFEKPFDIEQINGWLIARGNDPLTEDDVPKYGQIVDNVACGFLCLTDVSTCFLECFITNPEASSEDRDKAIRRIVTWALNMAAVMGHKRVIAISEVPTLITRALEMGFKFSQAQVVMTDLGKVG